MWDVSVVISNRPASEMFFFFVEIKSKTLSSNWQFTYCEFIRNANKLIVLEKKNNVKNQFKNFE